MDAPKSDRKVAGPPLFAIGSARLAIGVLVLLLLLVVGIGIARSYIEGRIEVRREQTGAEGWHDARARLKSHLIATQSEWTDPGNEPVWSVEGLAALWRITDKDDKDNGVWGIAGDVPTDSICICDADDPRDALRAFAVRWERAGKNFAAGNPDPYIEARPEKFAELGPQYARHARELRALINDASLFPKP